MYSPALFFNLIVLSYMCMHKYVSTCLRAVLWSKEILVGAPTSTNLNNPKQQLIFLLVWRESRLFERERYKAAD